MTRSSSSDRYRGAVVWLLMVVYTLNFMDRQVMSVLLPAIQAEFKIGDTMAGLLHGTAFALFYVTLALPIARWADSGPRAKIIAGATALWSAATAACGFARDFGQLFAARVMVGVGEAGCSPAAYSLLAGYYGPGERSRPMAIYAAGIPLGGAIGFLGGGLIAQAYGWREAFWIFGIPGLAVALAVLLFVREPPRAPVVVPRPPVLAVVRGLWQRRSFRHATLATALLAAGGFATAVWAPSFFARTHGMPVGMIGIVLAALTVSAVPAAILGGRIADRRIKRDIRWHVWVPAVAMLIAAPFSVAALLMPAGSTALLGRDIPTWVWVALLSVPPTAATAVYAGPVLAAIQTMTPEMLRATTTAIFLFVTNLIGLGAGPVVTGWISDTLRATAGADSLRWSLMVTVGLNLWAATHFFLAARHLETDMNRPWEASA